MANIQGNNPLNSEFWVNGEYGGKPIQDKAARALTAAYGAIGVAHLIERSIQEMNLANKCEHQYNGLKPTLLENILCAQHVLAEAIVKDLENVCEMLTVR